MNKKQLAERLARQSHRSRAQAADSVDKLVYGILKDLRSGESSDKCADAEGAVPTAKSIPAPKKERPGSAGETRKRKS